jgi:SAM-dependent methyltransferase
MLEADPRQRFTNRVDLYARYRPGYPPAILDLLREECGLTPESVIADIGSGTGLLTHLVLTEGCLVYGVEPNAAMRDAGEKFLEKYPRFRTVAGSAERTTLPNSCADLITSGQAFHWFDVPRARAEFERVLKPHGQVALVWNERDRDRTPFLRDYENLLITYGTDYRQVAATYPGSRQMERFFGAGTFREKSFPNVQTFDFDGLRGRLLSSSYSPATGHPNREPMLEALARLFETHEQEGRVRFDYDTRVYYGRLDALR